MNTNRNKIKGFTLVELVVVLAVISALTAILVPTFVGYVRTSRMLAAISDAKTIKTTVEMSLMDRFQFNVASAGDPAPAFNKTLYLDQNKDKSKRQTETVGAFTSYSWFEYRKGKRATSGSQMVDTVIASGLDNKFGNEGWKTGKSALNPLKYNTKTKNCAKYLSDNQSNFALIVVYNKDFDVRMMQIYRKGILVTYINGEYIANTNKDACFVGENVWSTIYTDVGKTADEGMYKISIKNGQTRDDGSQGGWF